MPLILKVFLRALLLSALLSIAFVGGWISGRGIGPASASGAADRFALLGEVWSLLETDFYGKAQLDPTTMVRGALGGMLASLDDDYTVYQEPEKAAQAAEYMQGRQGGIGTFLRITDGRVFLYKPIRGGPAIVAGLQQDDEIVVIDSDPVAPLIAGLSVDESAVKIGGLLRGDAGTQVQIAIRRGDAAPFALTLTRAEVVVPSVEWQMMPGQVAYIRIGEFKADTVQEFDTALAELLPQTPTGLILDLRGNPGGFLDGARGVLGRFYDGVALREVSADGREDTIRTLSGDLRVGARPVVVLIDGGSASASEIVAGALREQLPGVQVVGETTYGKGSVQRIYALSDGGSARITTAHWRTPVGAEIQGVGVAPDASIAFADDPAAPVPCIADRLPPAGQTSCGDTQLARALAILTDTR